MRMIKWQSSICWVMDYGLSYVSEIRELERVLIWRALDEGETYLCRYIRIIRVFIINECKSCILLLGTRLRERYCF